MLMHLTSLPQTFYSRLFYAALVNKGKGIGLAFVLLLTVISYALPLLLKLPDLPAAQQEINTFFDKLPAITIKSGKLNMDRSSPYAVSFEAKGEKIFTMVFDTAYQGKGIAELQKDMNTMKANVLVTADFAAVRKGSDGDKIEIHSFGEGGQKAFAVTHDEWSNIGQKVARYFPYVFAVFFLPVFLVFLVLTFLKALLIKLLALLFKTKPDLAGAMRLAAAAALPVSIISFALLLLAAVMQSEPMKLSGLSGFFIWAAYALYGLWCADKASKESRLDTVA